MLEVSIAKRIGTLDLALELSVGAETLLVAGPNGAGKSTLLLLLLGVARPDRGRIALDGRTLFDTHADVPAEDRRLGYLPQDYALFPHLDALGNVAFGLARSSGQRVGGHLVQGILALRLLRPQHVQAHARDDRGEPPAHVLDAARAGAAESEPCLLDGVVSFVHRAEHPVGDRAQARAVPVEALRHPVAVAHVAPW